MHNVTHIVYSIQNIRFRAPKCAGRGRDAVIKPRPHVFSVAIYRGRYALPCEEVMMNDSRSVQLASLLDTRRFGAALDEVKMLFSIFHPTKKFAPVKKNFGLIQKLFEGRLRGYRACNTEYHDFAHTVDALLAVARLADGGARERGPFETDLAVCLFIAALLHDTGYIQESWDTDGTGAKYTTNHVERSVTFLRKNRKALGLEEGEAQTVERLIRCTGLSVDLDTIAFSSEDERYAGCLMGTADLLGQMSDRAYLEKLIFLYNEFREAGIPGFNTEFDILRKTVDFYEITLARLKGPYQAVFEVARRHFRDRHGIDENLYMDAIHRHIAYLHKIIEDDTTNFRHKLKRGPWIEGQEHSHH